MMHYGWDSMGWGWSMGFGMLFWVVILILIVWAIVYLPREHGHPGDYQRGGERRSAGLAILEERYARGEINRDEYLQKKQDILGRG